MKLKTEIVKNKFVVIETDSIGKEYSRLDTVWELAQRKWREDGLSGEDRQKEQVRNMEGSERAVFQR